MDFKAHWESIYRNKLPTQVSWYQLHARRSLDLIRRVSPPFDGAIIDVGGGASTLVDDLLDAGYDDLTVLDLSGAALAGGVMECRSGTMEDIPMPDASVDVVISNGVINLSFRKRRVIGELSRVLKPGGRVSIADIVSAKQLSQSIVNDPKLWAS